ncbi:MAG: HIT family protein [Phycisphaerales bacterium]|nr:MAG: HIT family protein [Phycisphaerales bacterium]
MSQNPECVFCKIAAGVIPAAIVHQDATAVAFLDIHPLAPGHLLIVPRDHITSMSDLPAETSAALARLFPRLGEAARVAGGAEGYNILLNNGTVAGQFVEHLHFHVIPRRGDDGLGFRWVSGSYAEGEAERIRAAVTAALKR